MVSKSVQRRMKLQKSAALKQEMLQFKNDCATVMQEMDITSQYVCDELGVPRSRNAIDVVLKGTARPAIGRFKDICVALALNYQNYPLIPRMGKARGRTPNGGRGRKPVTVAARAAAELATEGPPSLGIPEIQLNAPPDYATAVERARRVGADGSTHYTSLNPEDYKPSTMGAELVSARVKARTLLTAIEDAMLILGMDI